MKREELKSYIPNEVYWDLEAMHSDGKFLEDGVELYIKSEADSVMDALEAKIKSLEADIEESNSVQLEHLTSANELISSLEEENKSLRFNLEDWKHKAEEMELTAKSFDAEIARSHEKIKETESKYNQLCWQHDALEDECNKADERLQKLTNENADLVMEVEKLQERIKELENLSECEGRGIYRLRERIKELEDELQVSNRCTKDARERTKELEAVISKMETSQPKWISVKDRLPTKKDANRCLDIFVTTNKCPDGFCCYYKDIEEVNATHWMPLPSAPTIEESSSVKEG